MIGFFKQHDCHHVFLDVGANVGVQYRKLAEPQRYRGAEIIQRFRALFGPPPWCRVCTVAIEPNPAHAARLNALEARMRAAHAPPLHVVRAAAGELDGRAPFLRQGHQGDTSRHARTRRLQLAASLAFGEAAFRRNVSYVPVVDVARVVHVARAAVRRRPAAKLLMKLDAEGSEVGILLHLVRSQSLCLVDRIDVEWHVDAPHWLPRNDTDARLIEDVARQVRAVVQRALPRPGCRTALATADDESYYRDGVQWPTTRLCGSE